MFRRRVSTADALAFANALPPVLRAIFVSDWNVDEPRRSFADLASMASEVRELRRHHNFSTETSIADVAHSLWAVVNRLDFERMLAHLPAAAPPHSGGRANSRWPPDFVDIDLVVLRESRNVVVW